MKKQRGAISTGWIVGLSLLGIVITAAVVVFASYVGNYNYGNQAEQSIDAKYRDNQNVLSAYSLKIKEAAKINEKYTDQLKQVVTAALDARYGDDGSKAMWQWIQEQNPTVDPGLYQKLQQIVESGRDEFKVSQTELLDACRVYKTNLGYLWKGFWLRTAGYPKEGLDKKCTQIVSGHAKEAFEKGIDDGVQF